MFNAFKNLILPYTHTHTHSYCYDSSYDDDVTSRITERTLKVVISVLSFVVCAHACTKKLFLVAFHSFYIRKREKTWMLCGCSFDISCMELIQINFYEILIIIMFQNFNEKLEVLFSWNLNFEIHFLTNYLYTIGTYKIRWFCVYVCVCVAVKKHWHRRNYIKVIRELYIFLTLEFIRAVIDRSPESFSFLFTMCVCINVLYALYVCMCVCVYEV